MPYKFFDTWIESWYSDNTSSDIPSRIEKAPVETEMSGAPRPLAQRCQILKIQGRLALSIGAAQSSPLLRLVECPLHKILQHITAHITRHEGDYSIYLKAVWGNKTRRSAD